ncbi:resolvase [Caballeronia udeis]|uniref:Resolvase n=1 Tax=Caballeronia udeis TaxID=1232866 RepID=A0A158K2J1_9BURK|nr:recombinase family protein [Caballeronia udeis]SAL75317.1 resolvase [Caballeronia udeis]
MTSGQFVTYFRVSTQKQGASGLGLEAQSAAVAQYLNGGQWEVVGSFTEIETGKGADAIAKRPQLRAALALCKKTGARLLIAKLDRLARNVHFVSGLMESRIKFVAVDMPEANDLTIHIMAAFAEHEAKRIGERTKDALRAAKEKGVKLGVAGTRNIKAGNERRQQAAADFAKALEPVIAEMRVAGLSMRKMVAELNVRGVKAPQGGAWSFGQLQRVLGRLAA